SPKGTPLGFVYRRILEECTSLDEAERLLNSEKATTWMNLAACDRQASCVFEITPEHIGRRDAEDGVLPCTNHFRVKGFEAGTRPCPRGAEQNRPPPPGAGRPQTPPARQNGEGRPPRILPPRPGKLFLPAPCAPPPVSKLPLARIDLKPLLAPQAARP